MIRRLLIAFVCSFAFSGVVLAEPAAVIKEGSCTIPTSTGGVLTDVYHKTVTYSNTGVAILKCKAMLEDYEDGRWSDRGFQCGITVPDVGYFVTDDSHVNISANGNAVLTCKIKTDVTP